MKNITSIEYLLESYSYERAKGVELVELRNSTTKALAEQASITTLNELCYRLHRHNHQLILNNDIAMEGGGFKQQPELMVFYDYVYRMLAVANNTTKVVGHFCWIRGCVEEPVMCETLTCVDHNEELMRKDPTQTEHLIDARGNELDSSIWVDMHNENHKHGLHYPPESELDLEISTLKTLGACSAHLPDYRVENFRSSSQLRQRLPEFKEYLRKYGVYTFKGQSLCFDSFKWNLMTRIDLNNETTEWKGLCKHSDKNMECVASQLGERDTCYAHSSRFEWKEIVRTNVCMLAGVVSWEEMTADRLKSACKTMYEKHGKRFELEPHTYLYIHNDTLRVSHGNLAFFFCSNFDCQGIYRTHDQCNECNKTTKEYNIVLAYNPGGPEYVVDIGERIKGTTRNLQYKNSSRLDAKFWIVYERKSESAREALLIKSAIILQVILEMKLSNKRIMLRNYNLELDPLIWDYFFEVAHDTGLKLMIIDSPNNGNLSTGRIRFDSPVRSEYRRQPSVYEVRNLIEFHIYIGLLEKTSWASISRTIARCHEADKDKTRLNLLKQLAEITNTKEMVRERTLAVSEFMTDLNGTGMETLILYAFSLAESKNWNPKGIMCNKRTSTTEFPLDAWNELQSICTILFEKKIVYRKINKEVKMLTSVTRYMEEKEKKGRSIGTAKHLAKDRRVM